MKHKILIVDDNYAEHIKDMLQDEIKADYDLAYNGLEGFEKFEENLDTPYSLIIMDINMPIMNGIESIKNIRKIDEKIPIIVYSSMRIEKIISDSIIAGGNVFVAKGDNLIKEVKYWLKD